MDEDNPSRSQSVNYEFDDDVDNEDTKSMVSEIPPSPSNASEIEIDLIQPIAKKPKVEKKEIVKRTLPLVVDAVIFLLELIIAVGFLYFAYIYPNRERKCWADDYAETPLIYCTPAQ